MLAVLQSLQPSGRATVDLERIKWADFGEVKRAIKGLSKILTINNY